MLQATHGVVSDTQIIYRRENERLTRIPLASSTPQATELLQIAHEQKLHTLWVTPGSTLSQSATRGYVEATEAGGYLNWTAYRPGQSRGSADQIQHSFIRTQEGPRKTLQLNFPQWDLWEWESTEPIAVLAGIHYIERALSVSISKGSARAGRELMQRLNAKHSAWMRQCDIDLSTLPFSGAGKDSAFNARDIEYIPGYWLHAYDKNSMYLGALTGAMFGSGTPDYYPPGLLHRPNMKLPGLWKCKVEIGTSPYNGIDRPTPLYPNQQWLTPALLKLCIDLGYGVEVQEGYQWTESHRTLEDYANTLWPVRQSFKTDTTSYPHEGGRAVAYDGIKRIATTGAGLLNSDHSKRYDPLWYRPDMWVILVELAKERIHRQVLQIEQKYGKKPVGIATDCVYYLLPDSNPHTAIPGMTDRADKLGGYKVKHSFPATPELVAAMNETDSGGGLARVVREYEESLQKAG